MALHSSAVTAAQMLDSRLVKLEVAMLKEAASFSNELEPGRKWTEEKIPPTTPEVGVAFVPVHLMDFTRQTINPRDSVSGNFPNAMGHVNPFSSTGIISNAVITRLHGHRSRLFHPACLRDCRIKQRLLSPDTAALLQQTCSQRHSFVTRGQTRLAHSVSRNYKRDIDRAEDADSSQEAGVRGKTIGCSKILSLYITCCATSMEIPDLLPVR